MDVITYDLPERAEETATDEYDDGAPLDVALATAARIAIAEELRRMAREIDPSSDGCHREDADLLTARANELDPDGAQ